jgi:hypothetical protein
MPVTHVVLPAAAALGLGLLAPVAPAAQAGAPMRTDARPEGPVTSGNWSGYAVTAEPGAVTAVTGSWVVATATCDSAHPAFSGASQWVGIDGYDSRTVEQTGTDADCSRGAPRYYAWYEFVPEPGVTIESLTVEAGDTMSAAVSYADGKFTVAITDLTRGQSFSVTHAVPAARRASAEWIAEDNSAHFTDFGTARFGPVETGVAGTGTATIDARTGAIGAFAPGAVHAITMVDDGTTLAVPSPLSSDGTSFTVEWLAN